MTMIALERLKSNPYRDFGLHPYDQDQIDKLKASIHADGFWMSVVARPADDDYEIAFGHHRIESARQLGWTEVPIEVRDLTDWQMARMLASENATQRGSTAAAALDAVAALSKVIAYRLLRWENEATVPTNVGTVEGFSHTTCRGKLLVGEGIGAECIMAVATKGSFPRRVVDDALATLKESGRMANIVTEASALADVELHAEQEAAEQALIEAEREEAEATTKRERETAAKATRKAKRKSAKTRKAKKATETAETATRNNQPVIYDARCTHLFKLNSHAEVFRKTITGPTFQSYLPLAAQFEFAKAVIAKAEENRPRGHMMTAADIRSECWSMIETGVGMFKGKLKTAPERPYKFKVIDGLNFIRRTAADMKRGVDLLLEAEANGEPMNAKQREVLTGLLAEIAAYGIAVKPLLEKQTLKLVGGSGND